MTTPTENVVAERAITPDELRLIAEYACWDKFEDRYTSDPKKHPAWRAAALIESQRATIERVELEASAEKAGAGWQDISTAPKTGAVIIVCGCSFGPPVRTAYWGAGRYLGRKKGFEQAWVTNPGHSCDPQFWMPMPEPQALRTSDGGKDA